MRRVTGGRLLSACAAVLLATALLADAGVGASVKCGASEVPVTVRQKTTCKSLSKAFPRPKPIDIRLAYLQSALKIDAAKLGGRKGKRARAVQRRFGRAGNRALRRIRKGLPKALVLIDRMEQRKSRSSRSLPARALAAARCNPGAPVPLGATNGVKVSGSEGNGGKTGVTEYSTGGLTVRVTYTECGRKGLSIPQCPTASGRVDSSSGTGSFDVTEEWRDGETLVLRKTASYEDTTKARGQVGPDGRLAYVDVDHTQDVLVTASGGVVKRGKAERHVRVLMPGGNYDATGASVKLSGDTAALQSGDSFPSIVGSLIIFYRDREQAWQTPNTCAQLKFSPESGTRSVRKGETGGFSGVVIARADGGQATQAQWQITLQQNGTFSPAGATGPAPSFSYVVATRPNGNTLSASARVTSTAGVAEGTWSQEIKVDSVKTISGSFTGHNDDQGSVLDWAGTATFTRVDDGKDVAGSFQLASGQATVTASGAVTGVDCQQSGSQQLTLSPSSVWAIQGDASPYTYQVVAPFDAPATITVTWVNCSDPNLNGTTSNRSIGPPALQSGDLFQGGLNQTTADPFTYTGSADATGSNPGETVHWTWSMKGSP